MAATATLRIDQATVGNGTPDRSRTDGVTGQVVTLNSLGSGTIHTFKIASIGSNPDAPVSTPVLSGSGTTRTFTPTAPATYQIELSVSDGVTTDTVRRIFAIRTPTRGLRYLAPNELADPDGTLDDVGNAAFISASTDNEGGNIFGWNPEHNRQVAKLEAAGGGTDPDAVHLTVAGEIDGIASKATAVAADVLLIEDSDDSFNKKKLLVSGLRITESQITDLDHTDANAVHVTIAGEINALTLVTAAAGDMILIEDATDSFNKKRVNASDFLGGGGGGLPHALAVGANPILTSGGNNVMSHNTTTNVMVFGSPSSPVVTIYFGAGDTAVAAPTAYTLRAADGLGEGSAGSGIIIQPGAGGDSASAAIAGVGGDVTVKSGVGGNNTSTGDARDGGFIRIEAGDGGDSVSGAAGSGGSVLITAGSVGSGIGGVDGLIQLATGGAARLLIDGIGAWFVGGGAGTTGQALVSNGSGSSPSWQTVAGGTDGDAIHDNVAGEINAITAKSPLVAGDVLLIEDSADSFNKKKALISAIRITESQITDLSHNTLGDAYNEGGSGAGRTITTAASLPVVIEGSSAIALQLDGDLAFKDDHTIAPIQSTSTNGYSLTIEGGQAQGATNGDGGAVTITAGAPDGTGDKAAVTLGDTNTAAVHILTHTPSVGGLVLEAERTNTFAGSVSGVGAASDIAWTYDLSAVTDSAFVAKATLVLKQGGADEIYIVNVLGGMCWNGATPATISGATTAIEEDTGTPSADGVSARFESSGSELRLIVGKTTNNNTYNYTGWVDFIDTKA